MKNVLKLVSLSLMCALSVCAAANSDEATQKLVNQLSKIKTLSGNFEQLSIEANGRSQQSLTGHYKLAKPGNFYWKIDPPYEQLIVSNNKSLWLYDVDLMQVTEQPVSEDITKTPALLFTGSANEIEANYSVELLESEQVERYALIPKQADTLFEILRITFFKNELKEMSIEDSLGQKTLIRFTNTQINQQVDPEVFSFTPPEGVDYLKQGF